MPTTFQSHARLPFDDRLHRWTLCGKRMDPTFDVVIDQRDASIRFNQKEDKFVTNSKEACSIIASTSFVSFAKGTRSLVTEAPIIFFEEEEVNEYWILAFFLSNHVSIRKNKYESRKIRCYPLLFPAFPSRPALCFSSRILSSSFVLIPLRESFFISTCVVRLFASRREKQLEREIFTISSFRYGARPRPAAFQPACL